MDNKKRCVVLEVFCVFQPKNRVKIDKNRCKKAGRAFRRADLGNAMVAPAGPWATILGMLIMDGANRLTAIADIGVPTLVVLFINGRREECSNKRSI